MPGAAYIADQDETDALWKCHRVTDLGPTRAGYWLYKAFQWVENVRPVILP